MIPKMVLQRRLGEAARALPVMAFASRASTFWAHTMASAAPSHLEAASTLAVIAASHEPLLFLTDDLHVIAASASFCRNFQIDPASMPGRKFSEIGDGEWAAPHLGSLLNATASGDATMSAYEFDLIRKGREPRFLVLNAHRLDDGDKDRVRLLMAITDVTAACEESRKKDDLIRETKFFLQEVQHHGLQIIASVLMQSARSVQSEEVRGHLQDAHHRVMSIAALQRYLAVSNVKDVPLSAYLAQLCESLGASMIHDHEQLSIEVEVDNSIVDGNVSVSLGLIVTELVINSIKHAFPAHRHGKITVEYHSVGKNWTLSVKDNGIGIPSGELAPQPGLGTGIVQSLAKQLRGTIHLADAQPGTAFTLAHEETSANEGEPRAAA
jgi:two-component sensor histidine kinase